MAVLLPLTLPARVKNVRVAAAAVVVNTAAAEAAAVVVNIAAEADAIATNFSGYLTAGSGHPGPAFYFAIRSATRARCP